jgi:uncharacterized protein
MSSGLLALLDDIAVIAKVAAASLDDAAAQAVKASSKAAGIVIDDAAVTPRYVVGFASERELPIIGKIAVGSLKNKLLLLMPVAALLTLFAHGLITPLLMLGGAYLCVEGVHKLTDAVLGNHNADAVESFNEADRIKSAIRTDFILSAEIMAITLSTVTDVPLITEVLVLAVVAVVMTIGVYGVVAIIVKADDVGAAMARGNHALLRAVGRGLVHGMPGFLRLLAIVGMVAMLWVGGSILTHGAHVLSWHLPEDTVTAAAAAAARLVGVAPRSGFMVGDHPAVGCCWRYRRRVVRFCHRHRTTPVAWCEIFMIPHLAALNCQLQVANTASFA